MVKKTLHINPNISVSSGGLSFLLSEMIKIEQEIGVNNEILTLRQSKDINLDMFPCIVHILDRSFPNKFSISIKAFLWAKENISNYRLIIFHSAWHFLFFSISFLAIKRKIPFILWPHNSLDPFDLQKKPTMKKLLGRMFTRRILHNCTGIVCASQRESDELETYGVNAKKIVLPYSVSYNPIGGSRGRFRNQYNISDSDFVILSLSRIDYKKAIDQVLISLNKVSSNYKNIVFVIAGPDCNNYQKVIENLIQDLNLESKVRLIGMVLGIQKADAYMGSDLFILPSKNENFGIAPIEALNSGLPILITKNIYIWEDLVKFNSAWVCEANYASICQALNNILGDENTYATKKKNAKKTGHQFSVKELRNKYMEVYNSF